MYNTKKKRDYLLSYFILILIAIMISLGINIRKEDNSNKNDNCVIIDDRIATIEEVKFIKNMASETSEISEAIDTINVEDLLFKPTRESSNKNHLIYDGVIPLANSVIDALIEACNENGIPLHIGLGLIDQESNFQSHCVSSASCYGLCQLHPKYFPSHLSDEDNVRYGMKYLGDNYKKHNNWTLALNVYNAGRVTGDTSYANAVMKKAAKWKKVLEENKYY